MDSGAFMELNLQPCAIGTRFASRFLVAALVALCAGSSLAQQATEKQPTIVFQHINDVVASGTIKLANGVEVRRADWPTLIFAEIPTGADKPRTCTGTLVGPNVILLAAHCVDSAQDRDLRAELWIASRKVTMTCESHDGYRKDASYSPMGRPRDSKDYALCLLEDDGRPPALFAKLRFEVVDMATPLKAGEPVLMTGYGCDKLELAKNGSLSWAPRQDKLWIGDSMIEAPVTRWDSEPAYVSILSQSGARPALCPGDSGGPLFTGVVSKDPVGPRRLRGVNSMVCARRRGDSQMCSFGTGLGEWDIISGISATGSDPFRAWVGRWLARYTDKKPIICGVNRSAGEAPCAD